MKMIRRKSGWAIFLLLMLVIFTVFTGCGEVEKEIQEEETSTVLTETATMSSITDNKAIDEKAPETFTCTLSITCHRLTDNLSLLKEGKRGQVPEDGVIMAETVIKLKEGSTVFDLLQLGTRQQNIHMEFNKTPVYKSAYIEGINNIYEFDAGELSGWVYRVNGVVPNRGASAYTLKAKDKVEWLYSLDLGADVGGDSLEQRGE